MQLKEFLYRFRDPSDLTAPPALIEYLSKASVAYLTCTISAPSSEEDRESALLCHFAIIDLLRHVEREVMIEQE